MKYLITILIILTACTVKSADPKFKVGDKFSTNSGFYLGKGKISVTAVLLTTKGWTYLGEFVNESGQVVEDTEVSESDLL